jgi:uncharacterized protein with WD repeat
MLVRSRPKRSRAKSASVSLKVAGVASSDSGAAGGAAGPAVSEAAKKHKATAKKLRQISELLEAQAAGRPLEKNQLDKVAQQSQLEAELVALQLSIDEEGKTGLWR